MILFFLCNKLKPECGNSYSCGVECIYTRDYEYSKISSNFPLTFEEIENRFDYIGEFVYDGAKQTIWQEKERIDIFS